MDCFVATLLAMTRVESLGGPDARSPVCVAPDPTRSPACSSLPRRKPRSKRKAARSGTTDPLRLRHFAPEAAGPRVKPGATRGWAVPSTLAVRDSNGPGNSAGRFPVSCDRSCMAANDPVTALPRLRRPGLDPGSRCLAAERLNTGRFAAGEKPLPPSLRAAAGGAAIHERRFPLSMTVVRTRKAAPWIAASLRSSQ